MIKQVLFGACADTWCSVHSLRLHGSRVCPKCPPRVVDQLGTTFDRELPTCKHGFHECRMCNEGAQESGSEPEGADRYAFRLRWERSYKCTCLACLSRDRRRTAPKPLQQSLDEGEGHPSAVAAMFACERAMGLWT